jgi:hypothetical protein
MKQIAAVLGAVKEGCKTSDEVSALTGLSRRHCSAYLSVLAKDSLIVLTHRAALRVARHGRAMNRYRLGGANERH